MKKIFVSSTFRDMQAERDLVQEMVLPHLRNEARKYGENIEMLDLRWGVNTSELESDEGSRKVMSVCLEEIERSHPYMLIFMGERYGTMMPPKLIKEMVDRKNVPLNLDDYAISITALEVEYGALSEYGCLDNCVVCFREPVSRKVTDRVEQKTYASENEEATRKLEALKRRIQRELGDRVIFYSAEWSSEKGKLMDFRANDGTDLGERLGVVFAEMFHEDWEQMAKLSQEEREQLAVDAVIENRLKSFNGRETLLNDFYRKIVSGSGTLILRGCAGSGKTSIMCKIMKRLQQEGKTVFRFVSGNTPFSSNAFQLVKQLVAFLEKYLHARDTFDGEESDNYDFKKWKQRLEELCDRLPRGEKIYVVVDALDQLEADDHAAKMEFVPNCENVRVVASCTDLFDLSKVELTNYQVEELPLLMGDEIQEVIEGLFASLSKNAYAEYIDAIMWKENSDLPLYLSLIVQRLNMMNSDELYFARSEQEIIQKGVEIIDSMPDDLEQAILLMLKEAEQRVGIRNDMLTRIMRLLAVSRNGLRLMDMEMIFKSIDREFSYLDFARLRNYLDMFFVERENGFIDFGHKSVRQAILNSFEDKKYYHMLIGRNMWRLPAGDTFRLQEGLYHIYKSDEYTAVGNYLRLSSDTGKHASIAKEQMCKLVVMDSYGSWFQDAIENCREEEYVGSVDWIFKYLSEDWAKGDYKFSKMLNEYRVKMYEYILAAEDAHEAYKDKCIFELAKYYASIGDTQAPYYLEKAAEIRKRNYQESKSEADLEEVQEVAFRRGEVLYERGEYRRAAEIFEELLQQEQLTAYVKHLVLSHLGPCYGELGMYEQRLECILQDIELFETEEKQGRRHVNEMNKAIIYGNAGFAYAKCGNLVKAEEYIRKGERIVLPIFEVDKSIQVYYAMASVQGHWAAFYEAQGKWELVIEYRTRYVALKEVIYQKSGREQDAAELVNEYINLAYAHNKQEGYEKGIELYTKALRLCEKLIVDRGNRKDHKLLVRVYRGLCITYINSADYEKARAYGLNWQVEAEWLLGKERHKEDMLQCAFCYDNLRRTCKELGKRDEALQYCDKAIAMYEELAATDKSYEKEVATLREKRKILTDGVTFEKRERCENPLTDCDFTEGGTVDGKQRLRFIWKTEMWGCCKITIKIVNRKGEIIYSAEGYTKGEYGASPYVYSICAPAERGNYVAKVVWMDVYGHEYGRDFAFSVSGTIVKKPNPVKITTSIDDLERFVVSLRRENKIHFRAEIPGAGMGILEMRMVLLWDDSNEKICEKVMKTELDEYGSNPMTYWLGIGGIQQSGRIRFEITTLDYWGETTVRKFVKEVVHETAEIYITSTLDTEQVVKRDTRIKVQSYCTNGIGIRRMEMHVICKETGRKIGNAQCESKQKVGACPLSYEIWMGDKISAGYYTFRVTAEDVKGNTETKEWLVKVVDE